ncbi:hypothetical protein [Maricaulis parjimensis]|uniref:hypothetical protein n=1 Tax=Maricaulis parjimensis TaxID=144023 RepID=UPI001939E07F
MAKSKPIQTEYVDPIMSALADDQIVLEQGQIILLTEGDPPGGILSLGAGSTITLEAGSSIEGARNGDVGILALGPDTSIDIDGAIRLLGSGAVGAAVRDGHISLSGGIDMGGAGANGLVLNAPTASADIGSGGSIHMSGDGAAAVFAVRAGPVSNAGSIMTTGQYATGIFSGDGDIVNSGTILSTGDGATGLYVAGATQLTNTGLIAAEGEALDATFGNEGHAAAVFLNWDGAVVTNSGTIRSDHDAAIIVDPGAGLGVFGYPAPPAGTTNTIINEKGGLISGVTAIEGSDFVEIVSNAGRIEGDIHLGGGNDTYTAVGNGRIDGVIDGGAGDDVLIADHGQDTLLGGDGNDWLDGGKSRDYLDGGAGDDVMIGGQGSDTFVFSGGNDIIMDFTDADVLELNGYSLSDATVETDGDTVIYRWSDTDSLTVMGGADAEPAMEMGEAAFEPVPAVDMMWVA